jgi:chloramphenicol O-acetyltransferase
MVSDFERKIDVEIERKRIRVTVFHGEDEVVVKLNLEEAEELTDKLAQAIEDYSQRKQIRID